MCKNCWLNVINMVCTIYYETFLWPDTSLVSTCFCRWNLQWILSLNYYYFPSSFKDECFLSLPVQCTKKCWWLFKIKMNHINKRVGIAIFSFFLQFKIGKYILSLQDLDSFFNYSYYKPHSKRGDGFYSKLFSWIFEILKKSFHIWL